MKIFISSDFEGTAGVVDWDQVRAGGPDCPYFVDLLTREVNAAVEGATQGGATEVVVNDSHGKMANLRPDALAGKARYLSGRLKPRYVMEGLDSTFDAAFFVSYHGSMSSEGAVLSHTYFPAAIAEVRLNGTVVGESGINALVARRTTCRSCSHRDATAASELASLCHGPRTAAVKRSVTQFSAESLHPDAACELIRTEARAAMEGLAAARPPRSTGARLRRSARSARLAHRVPFPRWACGPTLTAARRRARGNEEPMASHRFGVRTALPARGGRVVAPSVSSARTGPTAAHTSHPATEHRWSRQKSWRAAALRCDTGRESRSRPEGPDAAT